MNRTVWYLSVGLFSVAAFLPAHAVRGPDWLPAAPPPPVEAAESWASRYDGATGGRNIFDDMAVSPDGSRVYATGWGNYLRREDYETVAIDAESGRLLWSARYDGGAGLFDYAQHIRTGLHGSLVFVGGHSAASESEYAWAVVAYDAASGAEQWVVRVGAPLGNHDLTDMAVSPDGRSLVGIGGDSLIAWDARTGGELWRTTIADYAMGARAALAFTPDGSRVLATAGTWTSSTWTDWSTNALDASMGALLWTAHHNGPGNVHDFPRGIVVSPDGSAAIVLGIVDERIGEFTASPLLVAYDATTGARMWTTAAVSDGELVAAPDRRVVVAGTVQGSNGFGDYGTAVYDVTTGRELWSARYDGPAEYSNEDVARAVAVSPGGEFVAVTGQSHPRYRGAFDAATILYALDDGRRQWVARYTGNSYAEDYLTGVVNPFPWEQSGEALAFSPDGRRLFMGGRTWGPEGDDYLVLAYCVRIPLPVAACPL